MCWEVGRATTRNVLGRGQGQASEGRVAVDGARWGGSNGRGEGARPGKGWGRGGEQELERGQSWVAVGSRGLRGVRAGAGDREGHVMDVGARVGEGSEGLARVRAE
ncbi:hypothetical protein AMTR_s00010p00187450 [Amborella trichopoda]|uniref:Uncharacterized protein n=1 Tax=Amborella trichopoda TaxID=13333 RepID=W1NFE4_AMBTC|nr:hypothetical protein AMTR_s00010p00187450 [Amborella trichopoda]